MSLLAELVVVKDVISVFTVLPSCDTVHPYFAFSSSFTINSSCSGKWSVISVTYPSNCPSLYIRIVYVTMSPLEALTGVLSWLYVAVVAVSFFKSVTSTCGALL